MLPIGKDEKIVSENKMPLIVYRDGQFTVDIAHADLIGVQNITEDADCHVPGFTLIAVYFCHDFTTGGVKVGLGIIDQDQTSVIMSWPPFRHLDMMNPFSDGPYVVEACASMCWTTKRRLRAAIRQGFIKSSRTRHRALR